MGKIYTFVLLLLNSSFQIIAANINIDDWSLNPSNYNSSDNVTYYGSNGTFSATISGTEEAKNMTLQDWSGTSSLNISGNGSLTIENLAIDGDFKLTIGSGISLVVNGITTTNGGDLYIKTGGSITFNSSVTFAGAGSSVTVEENGNVDINSTLTITSGPSYFNINGNLTTDYLAVTSGEQRLTIGASGDFKVINDAGFSGGGAFNVQSSGYFRVGGDLTISGGSTPSNVDGNLLVGGTISISGTTLNGTGTIVQELGQSTALPIELIDFTAKANANDIELNWATATELNNDYFDIERSTDGINFESIETISGAGNSSSRIDYSTNDYNPIFGTAYYRLKQTDFDGQFAYSPVVSVFWNTSSSITAEELNIYPNPYNSGNLILSTENIEPGESMQISIFSFNGQITYSVNLINPNNQKVNLVPMAIDNLPQGIYIVTVKTPKGVSRTKLVVE